MWEAEVNVKQFPTKKLLKQKMIRERISISMHRAGLIDDKTLRTKLNQINESKKAFGLDYHLSSVTFFIY